MTTVTRPCVLILLTALLFWVSPLVAGTRQVELVIGDKKVSSRPIVEFRARGLGVDKDGKPLIGHAYILLCREYDDDAHTRTYNAIAGFYPDPENKPTLLQQVLGTPGKVMATVNDEESQVVFRVFITPLQEQQ